MHSTQGGQAPCITTSAQREYSAANRYQPGGPEGLQIWDAETFECSQVLSASLGEVCSAQLGWFLCALT